MTLKPNCPRKNLGESKVHGLFCNNPMSKLIIWALSRDIYLPNGKEKPLNQQGGDTMQNSKFDFLLLMG